MANITRNFIAGKMNKSLDERLVPDGQYIDAMNIRMGSTENAEIGVIENTKGNESLTALTYINGTALSNDAKCIGAFEDGEAETIYWFVHDPNFPIGATGKLDMIVSFNVLTGILTYHVVSIDDGGGVNTTLNFNPLYLINAINLVKSGTVSENLLFFTDDYNPPRSINTTRTYTVPIGNTDQFSAESILVIKQPPIAAPTLQMLSTSGQENYMETRFLCFAYRYRYADNEYSATSQFSEPAFVPNAFQFSVDSYLNEGMVNAANAVNITYNSGDELVIGIDLLFKEAGTNIIKVIEKLDKATLGIVNNANVTYQFSNSKIFTILPESEILRLYDNVPLQAKAQTLMGNRLMYGNYVEGYDLVDENANPVKFEYTIALVTEEIGTTEVTDSTASGNYNINSAQTIADSVVEIDLDGVNLVSGASLSLDITFTHATFTGSTPFPSETTDNISLNFTFFLNQDYSSVYALASSTEFQDAIGTAANIQTVANACTGITFTDQFNCAIPQNLDSLIKFQSGISAVNQPIGIITTTSSTVIGLQLPAMRFVNNVTTPTFNVYEYYEINFAEAVYQEIATPSSLHSNRDYEIGIVYMDEFNRSSTALVSQNNTVHVPCGFSKNKNSIQVTIPPAQLPPFWATRYKFVIKPSNTFYETIYTYIFFTDPESNNVYFLLDGENAKKIEQGDRLIVKADSSGPTQNCTYATVLEKDSKASDFITINSQLDPNVQISVPAGVYMKINPNSFNIINDELAVIAPGTITVFTDIVGVYPVLQYPMNRLDSVTGDYVDYTVPAGSRIIMSLKFERKGVRDGQGRCETRTYILDKTFVASANYDNMMDWWNGDNIGNAIQDGYAYAGGGNCTPELEYIPTMSTTGSPSQYSLCTNYIQWYRDISNNALILTMIGTERCSGAGQKEDRRSSITTNIQVFRAENLIVFETEPTEALPDVFFENNLSLPIEFGFHMGNTGPGGNQSASTPAIVDTEFFNCYSFGNGVESYKVRDSIIGKYFTLGNRVTVTSSEDYRRIDRFADITYSGVYYDETNVNRLNEFNLGLQNFKQCEDSFGPIQRMDARETDVLVLQEDKISYVLTGKNILSDAGVGGSIAAIPEVLGTQVARTEKYGISFNPESYVHWGYNRFFTDVKRGAVIQLSGSMYSQDQLSVVSEMGMRTWFRSTFIDFFATQKLGGWDPYMNEYVLVINDTEIPQPPQCVACGLQQTFTLSDESFQYCVDLSPFVGDVNIDYTVISITPGDTFEVSAVYDGTTYTTGPESTSGTLTFSKDINNVNLADITVTANGTVVLAVLVNCPNQELMTVIQVVVTNDYDAGQTNHVQFRYTSGTYTSPIQTTFVEFVSGSATPLVSLYSAITGPKGFGSIPVDGSDVYLISNKIVPDTFDFDAANDSFKYYTSNTLYNNNTADITTLLGLASTATPITQSGNVFQSFFTSGVLQDYLYLIWDYRSSTATELCYSNIDIQDVCCGCL